MARRAMYPRRPRRVALECFELGKVALLRNRLIRIELVPHWEWQGPPAGQHGARGGTGTRRVVLRWGLRAVSSAVSSRVTPRTGREGMKGGCVLTTTPRKHPSGDTGGGWGKGNAPHASTTSPSRILGFVRCGIIFVPQHNLICNVRSYLHHSCNNLWQMCVSV